MEILLKYNILFICDIMDKHNPDREVDEKIQQLTKSYLSQAISKDEFKTKKSELMSTYSPKTDTFSNVELDSNTKYSYNKFIYISILIILIGITYALLSFETSVSLMSLFESLGRSNIPIIAAFFIGLMTAISPCPLATNITAIAYASKRIENSKHTLLVGVIYTIGRMIIYIGIAAIIVWIGISTFSVSLTLQKYGNLFLGPVMIIFGILMLNLFNLSFGKSSDKLNKLKEYFSEKGLFGSLLLGMLFAVAFCPISGVFYFGMLIPLALQNSDPIFIPSAFAIATGLPVIVFSMMLVFSVSKIGNVLNKIQTFEKYMRKAVALIFMTVGLYYIILL